MIIDPFENNSKLIIYTNGIKTCQIARKLLNFSFSALPLMLFYSSIPSFSRLCLPRSIDINQQRSAFNRGASARDYSLNPSIPVFSFIMSQE
jgi:hypothetical protein